MPTQHTTLLHTGGVVLLAVLLSISPRDGFAQTSAGVHLGYNLDVIRFSGERGNGALAVGFQVHLRQAAWPLMLNPSFDYFFNGSLETPAFQISMNGLFPFELEHAGITPFAGAGLTATVLIATNSPGDVVGSSTVDFGFNLIAGAMFEAGGIRPFVQGRVTLGKHLMFRDPEEGSGVQFMGGILLPLGN